MTDLSIADVLERAADLIEPEGAWHQHHYVGPKGGCWCVLGAIMLAGNYGNDHNPPSQAFSNTLGLAGIGYIADWNDAPDRTQAEVVAKLREAAALAREQGK